MGEKILMLIVMFLIIGNIDLEFKSFKLRFSGIVYKVFTSILG